MSLLLPLGLLLAATIPVVVALYLLKVRRHDEEISSTFLWDELVRDLAAHEPIQRLRWSVLLVLELLALAALTVALARPALSQVGPRPVTAVLVLDTSASMQAADVAPSRFARAVQDATRTLDSLAPGSRASLILAGPQPQMVVAPTADRASVASALARATPTGGGSDMRAALLLARSLGSDAATRRLYVFTDGAFNRPADLPTDLGDVSVDEVHGERSGNVAITAISTRADPADSERQQVFVRVQNFSDTPARGELTAVVDGKPLPAKPLSLSANGTSDSVFDQLPRSANLATVSLRTAGSGPIFTLDKTAYAVLSTRRPARVLLVSTGGATAPLQRLLSLLPGIQLFQAPSTRFISLDASSYDVVVFNGYLPPSLPRASVLAIDPPPQQAPFAATGTVTDPRITGWSHDSPLLAYVDLPNVRVSSAMSLNLPGWLKPVITAQNNLPLLAAGEQTSNQRVVVLAFDLEQSNLLTSAAFPILMANAFQYLAPPPLVQAPSIRTGEAEPLAVSPQARSVQVIDPRGRITQLPTGTGTISYTSTGTPGVYQVVEGAAGTAQQRSSFAANLADPSESDLRPRLSGLGSSTPLGGLVGLVQRELWIAVAGLALPLLLVEWYWFHRRT